MTQPAENVGVFLLGFGAPRSPAKPDLRDFLQKATRREPSEEMVASLSTRYKSIGGRSPLPDITARQARALQDALAPTRANGGVFFGMRFGEPSMHTTVQQAKTGGIGKAVAITQAPHHSETVLGAYRKSLAGALEENGADIEVCFVESYGHHPDFIDGVCVKLKEVFAAEPSKTAEIPIIFTAHSLPARSAGAERYVREVKNTAAGIARAAGNDNFTVAFQSRGAPGGSWLGPSVEEVMEKFSASGVRETIIAPVGFVAENLETLYDLDLKVSDFARKRGIRTYRVPTLDDSPHLVSCWKELVLKKLEECD